MVSFFLFFQLFVMALLGLGRWGCPSHDTTDWRWGRRMGGGWWDWDRMSCITIAVWHEGERKQENLKNNSRMGWVNWTRTGCHVLPSPFGRRERENKKSLKTTLMCNILTAGDMSHETLLLESWHLGSHLLLRDYSRSVAVHFTRGVMMPVRPLLPRRGFVPGPFAARLLGRMLVSNMPCR